MKTYEVVGRNNGGTDMVVRGTISMDDAGAITYTARRGYKRAMRWLMDEPIPIPIKWIKGPYKPLHNVPKPGKNAGPPVVGKVTRESNPATWFEWLPAQYHGSALFVAEIDPRESAVKRTKKSAR